jgi:hypothetical protein
LQVQAAEKRVLELLARRDNLLEQVGQFHRSSSNQQVNSSAARLPQVCHAMQPTGSAKNNYETNSGNCSFSATKQEQHGNFFDNA